MFELALVFTSGFLGSSHCIGMCGPFALTLGGCTRSWRENLARQLVYSGGRVFTYSFGGAIAGFSGMRLHDRAQSSSAYQQYWRSRRACFWSIKVSPQPECFGGETNSGTGTPCLGGTFLASFLRGPSYRDVFLAGLFTGFLPCGLVYGFLALAAGTGNLFAGAATMLAFGLGTLPIMVVTGSGGNLLSLAARKRLLTAAAWCVVLAGGISIYRGVGFLGVGPNEATSCPFCADDVKLGNEPTEQRPPEPIP